MHLTCCEIARIELEIHLTTGTFNLLSKTDSLYPHWAERFGMDENQGPHPSSNFVLRRLNAIRGARNVLALSYAAEKTAQKSRELIEFKKDRLEVSAITAKTLRELCSRICSVAGAIRSLWLPYLDVVKP